MNFDVAGQQLTGTKIRHLFLHQVPAKALTFSRRKIPAQLSQNRPKVGQLRSVSVIFRQNSVTFSHFQTFSGYGGSGRRSGLPPASHGIISVHLSG
jgi:hypothetical protein